MLVWGCQSVSFVVRALQLANEYIFFWEQWSLVWLVRWEIVLHSASKPSHRLTLSIFFTVVGLAGLLTWHVSMPWWARGPGRSIRLCHTFWTQKPTYMLQMQVVFLTWAMCDKIWYLGPLPTGMYIASNQHFPTWKIPISHQVNCSATGLEKNPMCQTGTGTMINIALPPLPEVPEVPLLSFPSWKLEYGSRNVKIPGPCKHLFCVCVWIIGWIVQNSPNQRLMKWWADFIVYCCLILPLTQALHFWP